jgi:hypothetical protein
MGTELLLYDAESDQVHILNETALQVWGLCDGRHGEEEIITELTRRYPDVERSVLEKDTKRVIEDFLNKNLVTLEG